MSPLVSIIVPCFNAEHWLTATLESALAQTWPHKEIILINDGSTDNSLAVARQFEARGVTVIDQPNRGASAARNHGLRVARGDYIQFLDADDLISAAKIATQVKLLRNLSFGKVATCTWGRFQADPASAKFVDAAVYRDFTPVDFLVLAGETGAMMHPAAWLLPRAVIERAGPWNEELTLNDDGEYFSRALLASTGAVFCGDAEARTYYRSGLRDSLSGQRNISARRSQFLSIELIVQHLLKTEETPRTRQAAANHYQRFIHDYFPVPAELMQLAATRVRELRGSTLLYPPMGPRAHLLASLIGWKNVWRLKHLFTR